MKKNRKSVRKLSEEDIKNVFSLSRESKKSDPTYRDGQVLFNALCKLHPDVADAIKGTVFNPFYNDECIDQCVEYLTKQ